MSDTLKKGDAVKFATIGRGNKTNRKGTLLENLSGTGRHQVKEDGTGDTFTPFASQITAA